MEYLKFEQGAYNLHVIKTNKFKSVSIKINFRRKAVKEEVTCRNFLAYLLLEATKRFPTSRLLDIEVEHLYDMSYNSGTNFAGIYSVMSFQGTFLNEKYTEDGMMERSFHFLLDFIFNPLVENGKFNQEMFDLVYHKMKERIETLPESFDRYGYYRMLEELDSESVISYYPDGYLEDLDKITVENLYEYYENVLKSDGIDIFVIGDVNIDQVKNFFLENFKVNVLKKPLGSPFLSHKKIRKRAQIVKEKADVQQAKLYIGCKFDDLTPFERKYVVSMYSFILGGGADSKLFSTVREKHSLCYSISSSASVGVNLLTIRAGIDASAFQKAVRYIRKEIKNMAIGKFTDDDLEKAKTIYIHSLRSLEDSPGSVLSIYQSHEYFDFDLIEERKRQIQSVTRDMIIELAKKIHVDTIYLLEGGNDDGEETIS